EPELPESSQRERSLIDRIWEIYGKFTAYQLSALSHELDSPWDITRKQGKAIIPNEVIFEHFKRLATKAD
ncbi:MAG: type II toxin-antitoxin system antitoxin SocA domain-containing protein, partial [Planctomycetota bacterium]